MHAIVLVFATILLALWPARIEAQCGQCDGDFNGDGRVTIHELVTAVNNALHECAPSERFIDQGNGTVLDTKTGLLWEKKSDDGSVHDKDDTYSWSTGSPYDPDGTAYTSFLATLNQAPCFAGHCDWRLPSASELHSLVDYGHWAPAVDAIFNTACTPGCTGTECSCTTLDLYWSSTTFAENPTNAWNVEFNYGIPNPFDMTLSYYVRAVRGGV